jgi:preprotein translocase subunit YajC
MYDQFFHTVCLLYVYTGVTLIQTCREDVIGNNESVSDIINEDMQIPTDIPLNSCAATCPNLYQALSVYVATLEMFTFALILPLLFLPCIYLWFLRRATAEAEAFAQLQDRLQEEEALLSNGGITASEILDSLENVKLVSRTQTGVPDQQQVWLLPSSATDASIGMNSDVKECCICMSDFPVQDEEDLEDGLFEDNEDKSSKDAENSSEASSPSEPVERGIVRTRCGHIFHKECLSGWVGGRWQINPQANSNNIEDGAQDRRRRRARQTCCPLCREDLRPVTN